MKILSIIFSLLLVQICLAQSMTVHLKDNTEVEYKLNEIDSITFKIPTLIAWWPFGEGSGAVAYDSTKNGHNGTLYSVDWLAGGIELNQNTDYVEFEDNAFELSEGSWEIVLSIKYLPAEGTEASLVDKDNWLYNDDGRLKILSDGKIKFDIDAGSNSTIHTAISTNPIQVNTDVYVIASWGSQGMKLYINNMLEDSNEYTGGIISEGKSLTIGANWGGSESFIGSVNDFKIYNSYIK